MHFGLIGIILAQYLVSMAKFIVRKYWVLQDDIQFKKPEALDLSGIHVTAL